MFDHLSIRASDHEASHAFYTTVLGALGHAPGGAPGFSQFGEFFVAAASDERPPTRHVHVGFTADSRAQVDAFWQAGVDAGYASDGEPGERPQYLPDYYGAFLLDPDGNSIEAVHYETVNRNGLVDHVWLRVLDTPSARAFYETIAPAAHLTPGEHDAEHAIFRLASGGSFSLVNGTPTEALHMAFSGSRADVDAFHAAAMDGGYTDNGGPGIREQYAADYYAAFVIDPDGNNIEVVDR